MNLLLSHDWTTSKINNCNAACATAHLKICNQSFYATSVCKKKMLCTFMVAVYLHDADKASDVHVSDSAKFKLT